MGALDKAMTQAKIMDMHNLPDGISIVDLVLLKRRVEWMSDNSAPISRAEILQLIELAKYYAALKRFIEQDSTWQDVKKVQPVHDGIVLAICSFHLACHPCIEGLIITVPNNIVSQNVHIY